MQTQNTAPTKKHMGVPTLFLLGLISGLSTAIIFTYDLDTLTNRTSFKISELPVFSVHSYIPGILFGLAIALYFLLLYSFSFRRILKSVLFVVVSCIAWFLSVKVGFLVTGMFGFLFFLAGFIGFFAAGVTGSIILLIGLYGLIFETPMQNRQVRFVLLAGILGMVGFYAQMFPTYGDFFQTNLAVLFIVWQSVVGLLIGSLIPKN